MTELEHIEIEGFKGLEHVEFEPTDINLITGRNNTGKTSFLEAVDLLFNPGNLVRFRGNVESVINVNRDASVVNGKTNINGPELHLRQAHEGEVVKYFTLAVADMLEAPSLLLTSFQEDGYPEIEKIFNLTPELRGVLERKLTESDRQDLRSEFLVLSTDRGTYPYFIPSEKSSEVMTIVYNLIENKFSDEFGPNGEDIPEDMRSLLDNLGDEEEYRKSLSSLVAQSVDTSGEAFLKKPEDSAVSRFIKSVELTEDIERNDDENEPIRIDDIGDYIKDTGLVDNLKTFTLDYLVYEGEDGGKEQIPYDFMGDGFKSIVGLLWELMDDDVENDIVLIEEPETHMHPGYVAELVHFLIDLARNEGIQFFITTHDHDFIKDFFMDMPDEKREYLEEEFSLVKMDDFGADVMDYEDAEHHLKDLHLDLRGI